TLIFAEVVYTFFRYTQTFGGSDGIQGLPDALLWRGVAIDTPRRKYYLVLVYLAAAYAICRVVVTSHFGRVLVAIRENEDRKSTRLNSSHVAISYAVFCLKKKNASKHEPAE